jgi:hypothetical protein
MYHERDEDENFMQLGRWTKNCGWTNYFSTLTVKLNSPRAFLKIFFCDIKNLVTPPNLPLPPKRKFG